MIAARVCFTLVADRRIEQELLDYLSEQTDLVNGFTVSDVTGHGTTVRLHSITEQVKGRADRVLVRVILEEIAAPQLVDRLETAFAGAHLVYWVTPVSLYGVIE
jgi:uncharacterized protein DUF3240